MNPTLTIIRSGLSPQVGWPHLGVVLRRKFRSMESERTETIQIVVNGQVREVPGGLPLSQILALLDVDAARVAVELNRNIIGRTSWANVTVNSGATLEIVQFVGGG
jgi:sulfur carrier protein